VRGNGDEGARTTTLAVCVATMGRRAGLESLLEGLAVQHAPPSCRWHVVVVDNDAAGSAEAVVTAARARLRLEINYCIEPRRGVAHARNRAVQMAGAVDWVAFIDDDECPTPQWLATLLDAQSRFDADVVTGPVVPHFPTLRRPWIARLPRFNSACHPTGTRRPLATTGNALAARRLLGETPFDGEHFRDGGEDTDCFLRLARGGAVIVWAADAVVAHCVPPERQTVRWLTGASYRAAREWTRIERRYSPRRSTELRRGIRGLGHIVIGAGLVLAGSVQRRPERVAGGLSRTAVGAGQLVGLGRRRPPPR
jgi:glycosyltransferase involved in cell wall biosynthesis